MEDVVETHVEYAGDLEGHLDGRGIAGLFDGDDGLPGDADPVGKLGLGHLPSTEPERTDPVGNLRGLDHD